jgi:uncharacterized protein
MPLFILTCLDKQGALETRMAVRTAHLTYLEGFKSNVKLAGPLLAEVDGQMIGSHLILEFPTLKDAESFAANDPYALSGLFASTSINVFRATIGPL